MLEGLVSFFPEEDTGGIGGINSSPETRRKYAEASTAWRCPDCSASNTEIWTAHLVKLKAAESISSLETISQSIPSPTVQPPAEEIKREEESQEESVSKQMTIESVPPVSIEPESDVVILPDGERVMYPSEADIRSFVGKMNTQIVVLDVFIGLLTAVLVWYLYFSP